MTVSPTRQRLIPTASLLGELDLNEIRHPVALEAVMNFRHEIGSLFQPVPRPTL